MRSSFFIDTEVFSVYASSQEEPMLIAGTIALVSFVAGALFARRRMCAALPEARALAASTALSERSGAKSSQTLRELAGVLFVHNGGGLMSSLPDLYVVHDGRRYDASRGDYLNPALLGMLVVQIFSTSANCTYCRYQEVERFDIIDRVPAPEDMPDFGYVRRWAVGAYCALCGLKRSLRDFVFHGDVAYRTALEPFASVTYRQDALKVLAERNGKLTKEIRYQMLSEAYAHAQPEAAKIADEMRRLAEDIDALAESYRHTARG